MRGRWKESIASCSRMPKPEEQYDTVSPCQATSAGLAYYNHFGLLRAVCIFVHCDPGYMQPDSGLSAAPPMLPEICQAAYALHAHWWQLRLYVIVSVMTVQRFMYANT